MTMLKSGWVIVGSAPSARRHDRHQGHRLPHRARFQRQGRQRHRRRQDQHALGQHGDGRRRRRPRRCSSATPASASARPTAIRASSIRRPSCASSSTIADGKPPVVTEQTVVGERLWLAAQQGRVPDRPDRPCARAGRHALCLRRDRQPHQRDLGSDDARPQRRHRPHRHAGRPVAEAARARLRAERPSARHQRAATAKLSRSIQRRANNSRRAGSTRTRRRSRRAAAILFGIAMTPAGDGFYYVEDESNTLVLAK